MNSHLLDQFLDSHQSGATESQVTITPINTVTLYQICVQDNEKSALSVLGFVLPPPSSSSNTGGLSILSVSPDQFWLIQLQDQTDNASATVALLLSTHAHVDLSGARYWMKLSGPGQIALLSRLSSIDFHADSFLPGHCAQTVADGIPLLVWRHPVSHDVHLAAPTSYRAALQNLIRHCLRA